MTDDDKPWAGHPCHDCKETMEADDDGAAIGVITPDGSFATFIHRECQALGIIGHEWGVCPCTGYEHNRAAALELKRRIYAHVYRDLQ